MTVPEVSSLPSGVQDDPAKIGPLEIEFLYASTSSFTGVGPFLEARDAGKLEAAPTNRIHDCAVRPALHRSPVGPSCYDGF
jgi:hypothetical protein